mgnify:CR=1 FL=1|jgi:hypothetical protein
MISIIIPYTRPEKLKVCIRAIEENAGKIKHEVLTEQDINLIGFSKMIDSLLKKTKYDLVMFIGDDTIPQKGFLEESLKVMDSFPDKWGVVGLSTEAPGEWNTYGHVLIHKKILEYTGGTLYSFDYTHSFTDDELRDIADEIGRFKYAEKSKILHDHPINGRGDKDDKILELRYADDVFYNDKKTYLKRKRDRMQKKYGVKLAISIPLTNEMVYRQFLFSFIKVVTEYMSSLIKEGKPISFDVIMPDFPCQIDAARNDLVQQALYLGCTHILMMDSDQIYNTDNMIQKMLDHDKPVLGARVHRRYPPFDPLLLEGEISKLTQIPDEKIKDKDGNFNTELQVDYTGTGCILYDMKIFNDMLPEKPFQLITGENGQPIGEDINFCTKLKKMGIPIFADCSIDIKHLTLMAADWGTHKLFEKIVLGIG